MDISFASNQLRRCAICDSYAIQKMGPLRARLFKQRLDEISSGDSMEDLRYLPGRFHELTGNLKGKWACSLDGSYRLLMTPHEEPIPIDGRGLYIWADIHGVKILEIRDYH